MALRQYWWAVGVIIGAAALSAVVGGYILVQQRFPVPGEETYTFEADFASAQAVTPGQGQQVQVAGVDVGEIAGVRRKDGRAIVKVRIKRDQLDSVHRGARLTLRPRTGLQDMTIDLDPGDPRAPEIDTDQIVPAAQTVSQVQIDEVLQSLDADTRAYFQGALQATAKGLGSRPDTLRRALRVATPALQSTGGVLRAVRDRRTAVRSLISGLGRLTTELADHQEAVGDTIDRASDTFRTIGNRGPELQRALAQLPSTLDTADRALRDTGAFAGELRRTSTPLRPALDDVRAALPTVDPLLRELPGDLRPLAALSSSAVAPLASVRRSVDRLRPQLPALRTVGKDGQYLLNEAAYNPPGPEEGYGFSLAWVLHNANSILSRQDANGNAYFGQVTLSCESVRATLNADAQLQSVIGLITSLGVCK
ncbi:MlaD family protein [Patulibacter defluvii]|uniref:MlaD family protein n=2 Tax=Bacteria TaxID=2 RepID=UPI002A74C751|nr:MlaD family protein [Patulibacter sp. DM4]